MLKLVMVVGLQLRFNTYSLFRVQDMDLSSEMPTKAIPDLKPEIVKNLEFGIDAKLWKTVWDFNSQYTRAIPLTNC